MIAVGKQSTARSVEASSQCEADRHGQFLKLLPDIRRHARFRFRRLRADDREEAVQEAVAQAMHSYIKLWRQGREQLAFTGTLASFAVARVRDGRRLGTRRNVRDVTSIRCQRHGV
jgi:DNA-directed RNA polymerase specialized sigma24 family protein